MARGNESPSLKHAVFRVKGDNDIGLRMSEWHAGMGDPVYALASSFLAGRDVPSNVVDDAVANLRANLKIELQAQDRKHLLAVIRDLKGAIAESAIRSAAQGIADRINDVYDDDEEFPETRLDGDFSPATVAKLKELLRERLPSRYPMGFQQGTDEDRMAKRAGLSVANRTRGHNRYIVSKKNFVPMLVRWIQSSREEEWGRAKGILGTLHIGVD